MHILMLRLIPGQFSGDIDLRLIENIPESSPTEKRYCSPLNYAQNHCHEKVSKLSKKTDHTRLPGRTAIVQPDLLKFMVKKSVTFTHFTSLSFDIQHLFQTWPRGYYTHFNGVIAPLPVD